MLFAWTDDVATQKKIMTLNAPKEIRDLFKLQEISYSSLMRRTL
jgi:hypothetical protein